MTFLRKISIGFRTALISTVGLAVLSPTGYIDRKIEELITDAITYIKRSNLQEYVQENLEKIIRNQELQLDLQHMGKPTIGCGLPEEFSWVPARGIYDPMSNTIYLDEKRATILGKRWKQSIVMLLNYGNAYHPADTLKHELGHFYADRLSEELGLGNWPDVARSYVSKQKSPVMQASGLDLVSEGIAEYFDRGKNLDLFNDKTAEFSGRKYAGLLRELRYRPGLQEVNYKGYFLVEPIIRNFGKEGITYLIRYQPEDKESLAEFQLRALRQLHDITGRAAPELYVDINL